MSANYAIYTSPNHQPIPDHLPTLIVTPQGKPQQILYTYLHTNYNQENYLLTPSDQGDLCVAKLFPPKHKKNNNNHQTISPSSSSSSSATVPTPTPPNPQNHPDRSAIKCEASRNLKWTIRNEGIQNPVYKLTLPNPDNPQIEQPLFQVSKPNPNCPWWTLFYFTYAGHLIPPKRIEFGKILKAQPNGPKSSGETKITVTGKTEEEKAVWRTLGEGNEDMVEWILVCAALNVLDQEISQAAKAAGVQLSSRPTTTTRPSQQTQPTQPSSQTPHPQAPTQQQHPHHPVPGPGGRAQDRQLHPTGNAHRPPVAAPIRPAVYNNHSNPSPPSSHHRPPPQQARAESGPHSSQRAPAYHPPPARANPPSNGLPPGALPPGALPPGMASRGPHPPLNHHSKSDGYRQDPPTDMAYARSAPARHPPSHPQQHPIHPPSRSHTHNTYNHPGPNPQHYVHPPQHQHSLPPPHGPRSRHPPTSTPPSANNPSRAPIQVSNYPIQTHASKHGR